MRRKFIEIAANLTDPMFQGTYHGSTKHTPDLDRVLDRSWAAGVERIVVTGTNLEESQAALELCGKDDRLFCTVGCHPTQAADFDKSGNPGKYLEDLRCLLEKNRSKVVAWGEFGLDYDRLHFADKTTQLKYFEQQLEVASSLHVPLFLHCRAAFDDFSAILEKFAPLPGGVVHSFDGTAEAAQKFIELGFKIGLNGCSLKTQENLQTLEKIPVESLLLETDCPWCEVRPTHAGYKYVKTKSPSVKKEKWSPNALVKGRNEPSNIVQILEIVSAVKNVDEDELCEQIYQNTLNTFFPK